MSRHTAPHTPWCVDVRFTPLRPVVSVRPSTRPPHPDTPDSQLVQSVELANEVLAVVCAKALNNLFLKGAV